LRAPEHLVRYWRPLSHGACWHHQEGPIQGQPAHWLEDLAQTWSPKTMRHSPMAPLVTDALCRCYLGTTSHVELPTRNRVVMGKLLVVVLQGHLKRSKTSTGPIRSPIPTRRSSRCLLHEGGLLNQFGRRRSVGSLLRVFAAPVFRGPQRFRRPSCVLGLLNSDGGTGTT
jgi:hypothetical protein